MTSQDITVVMPVYNGRRYIREAVLSVVCQTVSPSEMIIIDDGSTDDSVAQISGIDCTFPVRVVRQNNSGQSAARNYGMRLARGKYIALLDQDDRWHPTHLELLIKSIESDQGVGWVYSNVDEIDVDGHVVTLGLLDYLPPKHPKLRVVDMIATDMFILPGASLIRKDALDEVEGFDERLSGYEDDDIFLRLFRLGWKNKYVASSTLQWRVYSTSTSYTANMSRSRRVYFEKLIKTFPNDVRLGRYWARELIGPRFFGSALRSYLEGLREKDWNRCLSSLEEMHRYGEYFSPPLGLALKMKLMKVPKFYYRLFWLKRFFG